MLARLREWVRDLKARYGAKSVMPYGSAGARSGIVLLLPMTVHCACVYERPSKCGFTTDIAGYTSCSAVRAYAIHKRIYRLYC